MMMIRIIFFFQNFSQSSLHVPVRPILCDILESFMEINIEGKRPNYLSRSRDTDILGNEKDVYGKEKDIRGKKKCVFRSEKIKYFKTKFESYEVYLF